MLKISSVSYIGSFRKQGSILHGHNKSFSQMQVKVVSHSWQLNISCLAITQAASKCSLPVEDITPCSSRKCKVSKILALWLNRQLQCRTKHYINWFCIQCVDFICKLKKQRFIKRSSWMNIHFCVEVPDHMQFQSHGVFNDIKITYGTFTYVIFEDPRLLHLRIHGKWLKCTEHIPTSAELCSRFSIKPTNI